LTEEILARVPAFRDIADVAASHHEKLDGSGYHRGRTSADLSPASRILAVADIYEALTAQRPYRAPMPPDEALALIRTDAGTKLCSEACDALEAATARAPVWQLPWDDQRSNPTQADVPTHDRAPRLPVPVGTTATRESV
jgi:HD-GYP domain-containing protein (c-di-GMP phosphodiesterase class II)